MGETPGHLRPRLARGTPGGPCKPRHAGKRHLTRRPLAPWYFLSSRTGIVACVLGAYRRAKGIVVASARRMTRPGASLCRPYAMAAGGSAGDQVGSGIAVFTVSRRWSPGIQAMRIYREGCSLRYTYDMERTGRAAQAPAVKKTGSVASGGARDDERHARTPLLTPGWPRPAGGLVRGRG